MMQAQSQTSVINQSLVNHVNSAVVIGLGETGQSCLRYLKNKNIDVIAMDSRQQLANIDQLKQNFPDVKFMVGGFDEKELLETELVVLSPGVPATTFEISQAKQAGVPVVGDIELFSYEVENKKVIAITGSNGKSTVTALCGAMLTAAEMSFKLGGNYGFPALDLLTGEAEVYVLELSSFQLESTFNLASNAAVVLNISADHLDRYESVGEYGAAKKRIFNNATGIVVNRQDIETFPDEQSVEKQLSFGLDEPSNSKDYGIRLINGEQWLCRGVENLLKVKLLKLKGQHNFLNALAALALIDMLGVNIDDTIKGLIEFPGLAHRFEHIGTWHDVEWINDSKGTNPGATLASISGQDKPIVLILGGDAKGADFSILKHAISAHVKAIVLFGRDIELIENILPDEVPRHEASDVACAVRLADNYSCPGDLVLFSPACASFDLYQNYQQRGDVFKRTVREYFS